MDHWFAADHEWWCRREDEASGYETEMEEFKERYPRPTLKSFMIGLKHTRPEE